MLSMPLEELEKAVGFDPAALCIFCEKPVERLSMGGPLICPSCDCGAHLDGSKWTPPDAARFYANARRRAALLQTKYATE